MGKAEFRIESMCLQGPIFMHEGVFGDQVIFVTRVTLCVFAVTRNSCFWKCLVRECHNNLERREVF